MEEHVTSLEISKRLKELGVKQFAHFAWISEQIGGKQRFTIQKNRFNTEEEDYSAFLASELGELLPKQSNGGNSTGNHFIEIFYRWNAWHVEYNIDRVTKDLRVHAATMPDAMGKMLIYLLENKLMTL